MGISDSKTSKISNFANVFVGANPLIDIRDIYKFYAPNCLDENVSKLVSFGA